MIFYWTGMIKTNTKTNKAFKNMLEMVGTKLAELRVKKGPKYVTLKFNDKNIPEKLYTIFQKYITDIPSIWGILSLFYGIKKSVKINLFTDFLILDTPH